MKRTMKMVVWMAIVLLTMGTAQAQNTIVTFQDGFNGYDGTADTYLHTKYSPRQPELRGPSDGHWPPRPTRDSSPA